MSTSTLHILYAFLLLLVSFVSSFDIEGALDLHLARSPWSKRQNVTTCNDNNVQAQCLESPSACVDAICTSCAAFLQIAECCALASISSKLQCLQNAIQNPSTQTTNVSASTVVATAGLAACEQFQSMVDSCGSQTPGFSTAPFNSKAGCLCYQSGTYQPNLYDGAYSNCLGYLSTADPSGYDSITASHTGSIDLAPCINANVSTTPSSTPTTTIYIGRSSSESQSSPTTVPSAAASQTAGGAVPTSTPNQASVDDLVCWIITDGVTGLDC
jgi:hypothetical protein